MSQWEDNFKSNPVHTTLANLQEALDDQDLISEDVNVTDLVDRIEQAVSYTESALENILPAIANQKVISNINSYLQNTLNELNSYKSNNNVGHLNNTTNHIDNLITQVSSLPIPRPKLGQKAFVKSAQTFKTHAEAIIEELKEAKNDLGEQVKVISMQSDEKAQRLIELDEEIKAKNAYLDEQIALVEEQIKRIESTFQKTLDENLNEKDEEINELIASFKEAHAELTKTHDSAANNLLDALREYKKEAADLVQIIGNIGITGNYKNAAKLEKEAADKWRNIAMFLMMGMVAIVTFTVFISVKDGFDWQLALFKIAIAAVLGIPAAYAARESAKHRTLENHNRRAELELASLGPFLEKLPEEQQHTIRQQLTARYFGRDAPVIKDGATITTGSLIDLLKLAIKGK